MSASPRVACPDVLLMLALSPCSSRPAGEQLVKTDQVVDQPDGIPQHPDRLPGCHFEGVSGRFCLFASPPPKRTTPREVWEVVEKMVVAPTGFEPVFQP